MPFQPNFLEFEPYHWTKSLLICCLHLSILLIFWNFCNVLQVYMLHSLCLPVTWLDMRHSERCLATVPPWYYPINIFLVFIFLFLRFSFFGTHASSIIILSVAEFDCVFDIWLSECCRRNSRVSWRYACRNTSFHYQNKFQ